MSRDKQNPSAETENPQSSADSQKTSEKNKKIKKQKYVDDGHTIYNMDGVESPFSVIKKRGDDGERLSRAEKRAAIKAALQVYMPIVLGAVACFALVGALMYLWLR